MKKGIVNIIIILIVSIVFYFLSINFFFRIPDGNGYALITYLVGAGVAIGAGFITAIILYLYNHR